MIVFALIYKDIKIFGYETPDPSKRRLTFYKEMLSVQ